MLDDLLMTSIIYHCIAHLPNHVSPAKRGKIQYEMPSMVAMSSSHLQLMMFSPHRKHVVLVAC